MGLSRKIPPWKNADRVLHLDSEKDMEVLRQAAMVLERENTRLVGKVVELTNEILALKGASPGDQQTAVSAGVCSLWTTRN